MPHASGGSGKFPARLAYHGPAFRFQPNQPERPSQFCKPAPNAWALRTTKAPIRNPEPCGGGVRAAVWKFLGQIGDLALSRASSMRSTSRRNGAAG